MLKRAQSGRTMVAILEALDEHGPMTRDELDHVMGCTGTSKCSNGITNLRKRELVHIVDWRVQGHVVRPVWEFGPGTDKRRPKPRPKVQVLREWRERKRRTVSSVFDLGQSLKRISIAQAYR